MICINENLFFDPHLGLILQLQNHQEEVPVHIKLDAKLAGIFHLLLSHQGELVDRKTFIEVVWDGNAWVGEKALTRNISRLRTVLKQKKLEPYCWIKTFPKKGYSLLTSEKKNAPQLVTKSSSKMKARPWWIAALILASLLLSSLLTLEVETVEEDELILRDEQSTMIYEKVVNQE